MNPLAAPLRAILGLIEDGVLVRDVSKDHEPWWQLRAITLVRVLKEAQEALEAHDKAAAEPPTAWKGAGE